MVRDIELRLDITDSCNLRCIMCHLAGQDQTSRQMSLQEFKRIAGTTLSRVNVLFLSWAAEPLLNRELPAILSCARAAGVPCVVMVSNLTLLTAELARALVKNGLSRLNISIDAADPALYAIIRQRDALAEVLKNVRLIQDIKKEQHTGYPRLAFNMVLLKMNLPQIIPLIDCAAGLGVNELNCSEISVPERYNMSGAQAPLKGLLPTFNLRDEIPDFTDETVRTTLAEAFAYASSKGVLLTAPGRFTGSPEKGLRSRFNRIWYIFQKARRFPVRSIIHFALAYVKNIFKIRRAYCSYPWRQMVISSGGNVGPCCVWDENAPLGTVAAQSLSDIWQDTPFKQLRKDCADNHPPLVCKQCTRVRSRVRHGL
jgi:MoaA/NifB/PqqE/SkfB family radical SAM enzyme